jgi:bifunctional DNA-binding transcriptional regulator/antitoxin component of YhaV-PrlF toxin-antitoxin module
LGKRKKDALHRGIIVEAGRITIPKDLRVKHKLTEGTFYEIMSYDEKTDVMTVKFFKELNG